MRTGIGMFFLVMAALVQPAAAQTHITGAGPAYPVKPMRMVIPFTAGSQSDMLAVPLIKSGKVLPLAVTTAQRAPLLPDVPTAAEAALPGFQYDGWFGIWVHSRTPRNIINLVAKEVATILELPDVKDRIVSQGAVPKSSTPEELNRLVRSEIATRTRVLKASGGKAD